MLFTKNGAEKVNVTNSHGVRSAQCSTRFDLPPDLLFQNAYPDIHNGSLVSIHRHVININIFLCKTLHILNDFLRGLYLPAF